MPLTDEERRAAEQRAAGIWRDIREAAEEAFDAGRPYRYHDGRQLHVCDEMRALADVTRPARKRDGVRWREDR